MRESTPGPGLPRRGVLRALALAPAALAGCAAGQVARVDPEGAASTTAAAAPPAPAHAPSPAAVAAVRAYPLAADAEPAFVFRAAAARPGEPR